MTPETPVLEQEVESIPEVEGQLAKAETLVRQADESYIRSDEARGKIIGYPPGEKEANEAEGNRLETEANLLWVQIGEIVGKSPDVVARLAPSHLRSQKQLHRFQ
jgi:hypothetical protein